MQANFGKLLKRSLQLFILKMHFSLDSNIQSIIVQLDDAKLELVLAIREVIRTSNKDIKEKIIIPK